MSNMSISRTTAWMVWFIASIFYAYQYILRVMPNVMLDDIMQQFQIGAATFGQFSGIYYIGYSLMHLPLGIMLDRWGPRKIMTGCILMTVLGSLPLIYAEHWIYPIAGRLLIGMGSSAAILGIFKIVRMAFAEKLFSRMLSISVMIGLIGAIYGGGPLSYMTETLGYQSVIKIFAGVGVALAILTYMIVPDLTSAHETSVAADIKEVLGNGRVLWTCLMAGMMVGPLEGFADIWGKAFLTQTYGMDSTLAASLPSMIFIGMCFGAPVLNFIAEKTGNFVGTIVGAGAVMTVSFCALLAWHLNAGMISFTFVLIGICCAYQILAIYKASTYVSENVAGLTTAVANMIIMIFGYAFHTAMGGMINAMGGPTGSEALLYGVAVIPAGLFIGTAGFAALLLKDKGRQPVAVA